jgi:small subunit ribosomal protein S27e
MTQKFVKVKCEKCKNEQMVFMRAASVVKCLVCGEILAEPTGGKARLNVKVLGQQEKEKPTKHEEKEEA